MVIVGLGTIRPTIRIKITIFNYLVSWDRVTV